ncbi:MAG: exosome complex component Rrp42, partial [Ignisphaera sp.]
IELARVIDRSIRESKAVPLDKLCIIPGKKVWIIWLDIYVVDHDGNLVDASMLAAMAALSNTYIPYYEVMDAEAGVIKIDKLRKLGPLPINRYVTIITSYKIGDTLVIDPTAEEEPLSSYRLAIAVDEEKRIVGIQKMGLGTLTEKELDDIISLSLAKADELIAILKKSRSSS